MATSAVTSSPFPWTGPRPTIRLACGYWCAGSHFYAFPTASPDGRRLAWIAWNHPQMPWDGTELRVADLASDGSFTGARTLMGSTTESVLQPGWVDDDTLTVISDRTGWWNLYRIDVTGGSPQPICPLEADFAGPLWVFGLKWYAPMADGRLLTVRTFGSDTLAILDPSTGDLVDITPRDSPASSSSTLMTSTRSCRQRDRVRRWASGPFDSRTGTFNWSVRAWTSHQTRDTCRTSSR